VSVALQPVSLMEGTVICTHSSDLFPNDLVILSTFLLTVHSAHYVSQVSKALLTSRSLGTWALDPL
jgi:hypothetical protein